jgi:hypothetical protein
MLPDFLRGVLFRDQTENERRKYLDFLLGYKNFSSSAPLFQERSEENERKEENRKGSR